MALLLRCSSFFSVLYLLRDHLFRVLVFMHAVLVPRPPNDGHGRFARPAPRYTLARAGRLPPAVAESSGLAPADSAGLAWTHGDGGTPATLYLVRLSGELLSTLPLAPLPNRDWEDLTRDPAGRLYIGDFGNNGNDRRDLAVYRLTPGPGRPRIDTIAFRYPDQTAFPPPRARRRFDCEALFYYRDTLHLFTKDRGPARRTYYYVLPARPGRHVAVLRDSLRLRTPITGAALSPDGRRVALLGYGAVFIFEGPPGPGLFRAPKTYRALPRTGQAEALLFLTNHDLLVGNERGRLFRARQR